MWVPVITIVVTITAAATLGAGIAITATAIAAVGTDRAREYAGRTALSGRRAAVF
jgi:hypothetical protein